jgi:hypothetical protein
LSLRRSLPEVIGSSMSVGEPLGDFDGCLHRFCQGQVPEAATTCHGE